MWSRLRISLAASLVVTLALPIAAQETGKSGKEYPDGHGGSVHFPLGDLSFADEVIRFEEGAPTAKKEVDRIPAESLGVPDYQDLNKEDGFLTLGCGGTIYLSFADNVLVDVEGPDLYVFEIGPAVEPMDLAISADGVEWIPVGEISGGRADVDISNFVEPGELFHHVRLTDLKSDCNSRWPGADIDSVGAIGSAVKLTLEGSVLFELDKADLTAEAKQILGGLAEQITSYAATGLRVEGHTDSTGGTAYNLGLSQHRAESVQQFLSGLAGLEELRIGVRGYGEGRPVASNETEDGQAKNRRVEIIVFTGD